MINKELNEAHEQLQLAKKILTEDYGIGSDDFGYEMSPQEEEVPVKEPQEECGEACKNSKINQIREIALQGLQEYAHDVDTEQYQFYKKIWLMCDKAVSEKENGNYNNNF